MHRRQFLIGTLALVSQALESHARPSQWAEPVRLSGVDNLHRVTENLYRGAQPTRKGFQNLEMKLKITTVLDLQVQHADAPLGEGTKLKFVKSPMVAWHVDDNHGDKLVRALRLIKSGIKSGKVFVHCTHGADRTGTVMALWRMMEQNWSADDAIDELRDGGFNFHSIFANIPKYLETVDIEALRLRVDG
jgi:protein tyrosine/serine phosphatase